MTLLRTARSVWARPAVKPFCVAFLISLVAACAPAPTASPTPTSGPALCTSADGKTVSDQLAQFATEWDDALKLAASTSRIALASPVSQLQRIRRDVQAQTWPDCATKAKELLVASMSATVDGYLAFMAQQPENVSTGDLKGGTELMGQFSD